jgi:hypothetical protein
MYTQNDLDDAVAGGAITAESAAALRNFIEVQRSAPAVDEEQFRLITGFNDIFVSIAAVILMVAVGWIGQWIGQSAGVAIDNDGPTFVAPLFVAATSWCLALFFTAKRRMALPSIILLLAFVGAVFATVGFLAAYIVGDPPKDQQSLYAGVIGAVAGAVAAAGAWLHWKRFRVPITIAAGAAAVAAIVVALMIAVLGDPDQYKNAILGVVLALGLCVFLFAMRWDSSDPSRVTRRSDVAFWLHLLAAPMIAHPIFALMGVTDGGNVSVGEGLVVVLLYILFGLTALAIDRRALLVSALAYVLFALNELFKQFGAIELNVALTALVIGSSLLLLSAFWHQAREAVVKPLPDSLRAKLPDIDRIGVASARSA